MGAALGGLMITGQTNLDDQHLLLAQCLEMVEEVLSGASSLELKHALIHLYDSLVNHLEDEGRLLWLVLPPEDAAAHQQIHDRALQLVREYWNTPDPEFRRLRGAVSMIRSHMHSLEEDRATRAIRQAVTEGRIPRRI